MTSAGNLSKFSLLGETNLQRATSDSHIPFHGAYYSYFILPILLIFNFQVLPTSLFFVFLNLFTAYILLIVVQKLFGRPLALLSLFFFMLSPIMIHHSLFAWILNPLPLLGILTLWYMTKLVKNPSVLIPVFLVGLLSGIGFGLQNLYLLFGLFLYLLILLLAKRKVLVSIVFLLGAIVGNLPMVIFDIRHDFYHVRTMWQYFQDVYITHTVSGFTDYYHFLYLFPYLFIFYAIISLIFYRIYKPLIFIPMVIYLLVSFSSSMVNFKSSTGMPPGITLASLEDASIIIAKDNPPAKFNVATLWDFDTRAHPLRYLLEYNHQLKPQPVEVYKDIDALYVFAPESNDIENPKVWELQVFLPYQVIDLNIDNPGYKLYKLIK